MWALFEKGELHADSELTGTFAQDLSSADTDGVLQIVDDAREEAIRRQLGRENG
jgi:RIO kinase 1